MSIKSLLLGSAAALVAVSGARAADTVVMVEPEPVEYVRVCDAYGTGFFYIPGTETCLKIGGYVRVRLLANDEEYNTNSGDGVDDYTAGTRVRARLDFDAREETELGMLRAKIRVQATNRFNGSEAYLMEEGYIQLGGLTMGYMDSLWTGAEGGIEDGMLTDTNFAAGDFTANRISYTYAANGFSGTISVEDDADGDFMPDFLGKLAYDGDTIGAYLLGVFDEDANDFSNSRVGTDAAGTRVVYSITENEFTGDDGADGSVVLKAGLLLSDLIAEKGSFKVEGHYAFDPSVYARVGDIGRYSFSGTNDFNHTSLVATTSNGGRLNLSSEWQIGASYKQEFGKVWASGMGLYGETFDLESAVGTAYGKADYYGLAGNLGYKVTKNFSVLGEVSYVDIDMPSGIDDFDQTRGFLEFKRSF